MAVSPELDRGLAAEHQIQVAADHHQERAGYGNAHEECEVNIDAQASNVVSLWAESRLHEQGRDEERHIRRRQTRLDQK